MTRPLISLGIDPSYSGFAMVALTDDGEGTITHTEHLFDFSPKQTGRDGARLLHIHYTLRAKFLELLREGDILAAVVEGYAPGSRFNREVLGELGGIVRLSLHETIGDRQVYVCPPTQLKKFVTGVGNIPKDNVLLHVYKKWGVDLRSNDVADAYGLARVAHAVVLGSKTKYEDDIAKKLAKTKLNAE